MKSFLKQIDESFKSLQEKEAKPDYLDLDDDGDKKEPMKQAAKQSKLRKAAGKSVFGKGDLDFKVCEKCSGKLTPHVKDECQRCAKNEAVDAKADLNDDGELSSWEQARKDAIDKAMDKEVDEASSTAAVAPVTTPYAFSKADDTTVEALGYKRVQEAMDKKYERLIEGYRDFALGTKNSSPNQTVNRAIREVAKQLKSIEETIKYTGRLKTESGISHSGFGSGTKNALNKISERLIKISERVRSLGE